VLVGVKAERPLRGRPHFVRSLDPSCARSGWGCAQSEGRKRDNMLRIYDVALKVLEEMRPAIAAIEMRDRDLARQMRRAASSVVLNIAEGSGSSGGTRRERYRNALGSAREVLACVDVAKAWRYAEVDPSGFRQIVGTLVNVTR
jgi:four helix bundle protein